MIRITRATIAIKVKAVHAFNLDFFFPDLAFLSSPAMLQLTLFPSSSKHNSCPITAVATNSRAIALANIDWRNDARVDGRAEAKDLVAPLSPFYTLVLCVAI